MATRQYIGARYVPKFYKNSNDGSTQWQPNVVYEPLMWVTLTNGHMYISRKEVPATVGTPADNIEWWLDVGSYNGWVESLDGKIDDLKDYVDDADHNLHDEIDGLKDYVDDADHNLHDEIDGLSGSINNIAQDVANIRQGVVNLMMFGDSFLEFGGWGNVLSSIMKAQHSYNYGVSATGFAREGFTTFHDQLTQALNDLTPDEINAVTHVVIGGGINDQWDDPTTLNANADQMFHDTVAAFPNAKVYYFANLGDLAMTQNYFDKLRSIKNYAMTNGAVVLEGLEYLFLGASSYFIGSDHTHPTALGYTLLGQSIFEAINGNRYDYLAQGAYSDAHYKNSFYKKDNLINCNILFSSSSAGDLPEGMYCGKLPVGYVSNNKTFGCTAAIDVASGNKVGTVIFRSDGVQLWTASSFVGTAYANATFNVIGLLD